VVAAAKYDGEVLIKQLADLPATSTTFREVEIGPLAPALRNVREAWITWEESISTEPSFPGLVDSYRQRLGMTGWVKVESSDLATSPFGKGGMDPDIDASFERRCNRTRPLPASDRVADCRSLTNI